ncbi:MAG: outer membrane lipid asymmetry maintenance protein MlaD [Alphaproteobacteria bacterium]|nr:outer membrane lipid asymmetry maintenance protein MlaD [Alphaproteobacteria bacterium]MBO7097115.1 outer membrane lipid asymmetry maintenance protein MlaD [Alphaproteobacteria bacterium]
MNKKPVETIMGIVVLLIAVLFLAFAYRVSDLQVVKGYELSARFFKVGGLNIGSDVRINGVKIGTVTSQKLSNEDYMVDVVLSIAPNIKLPDDSVVSITSDGLMGNKFVKIVPGHSQKTLQNGDQIAKTQDFETLEDLIGKFIFKATGD